MLRIDLRFNPNFGFWSDNHCWSESNRSGDCDWMAWRLSCWFHSNWC